MAENFSEYHAEQIHFAVDNDGRIPRGGEGGTSDKDDEEVFKNDTEAMKTDDLEGLDPDADMEDGNDDLLEPGEDEADPAENETLGTP